MELSERIKLEGCNFFRQRIVFSLLTGRPISIGDIRPLDDDPGVRDFETKFLELIGLVTNGTRVVIDKTGTHIVFEPGVIIGNDVEFDCGNERCISYFLEALILLAPFCKRPLNLRLHGVTNSPNEISVDAIRATWIPVFNRFMPNCEELSIKIEARGFLPEGGGIVTFQGPTTRYLKPVQFEKPGKICKIRGLAYVCKVSPSFANRMIDSAKSFLRGYIADVFITVDQRKGKFSGNSPGFGLFLTAETTEGVYFHGEAMSNPKGDDGDQLVAEEIGNRAATRLLNEIYNNGCLDTSAQFLAAIFMTLCDKDASKFLFGPLSFYTVETLRNLKLFFEHYFKIDILSTSEQEQREKDEGRCLKLGSDQRTLLSCIGVGYFNISKTIL